MSHNSEVHGTKFRPLPDFDNIEKVKALELGHIFNFHGSNSRITCASPLAHAEISGGLAAAAASFRASLDNISQNPSAIHNVANTVPNDKAATNRNSAPVRQA